MTAAGRAPWQDLGRYRWWPPTTLDRYLVAELAGPFGFGLSAFTLIFVATQLLALGRLVSEEHAPFWAAIEYFLWQMPQFVVLAIPMAMLLGTLLAMQRLSSDSELTAMRAGGISLARIVAPLLVMGVAVSFVSLIFQEILVPLANDQAAYVRQSVIEHASAALANLEAVRPLPGGGKQVTLAGAFDVQTQALLNVTMLQYDNQERAQEIVFADRATYAPPQWTFRNAKIYHFNGDDVTTQTAPVLTVDIGERPNQIAKQSFTVNDPSQLSRSEIIERVRSGQLSPAQVRHFVAVYAQKLALPFSAFVFTLIAVPFGLRPVRGGGTGLGFGVAVAIVFVYYVISTIFVSIGGLATWLAGPAAWTPNVLFTIIGARMLARAARAR